MRVRLVATAGLCTVLALLSGCGGKKDGTTATASTEVHESASAAPSASTAPTPDGGGGTSTDANRSGYVWADQAGTASYTVTNTYQFDSLGGQIHVQRSAAGSYVVKFDKIGVAGGIAHATAYGATSNFCNVTNWHPEGVDDNVDESVAVKCFTAAGVPADTQFLANFASKHAGLTKFSYLWADQPTTGDYAPNASYRYDSGGGTPKVKRVSTGRYQVYLPASADLGGEPYALQVTAYGSTAMHCKISATFVAAATHQIDCLRTNNTFADSQFAVTFASQGSFIGRDERRYGEYNDVSAGVVINSFGVYTVPAPELGQPRGQVIAYSEGGDFTYCHTGNWAVAGTTLNMVVRCFKFDGSAYESGFRVMVSW